MVDGYVDEQTIRHPIYELQNIPKAPLRYILDTALNLYCPAISQS